MKQLFLALIPIFYVTSFAQDQLKNEKIDTNEDGEPDYFIEYSIEDEAYFELIDTNYDGRVDESWELIDGQEVSSGKVDSDFDGFLETEFIPDGNQFTKILSDSNKNGIHDIVTFLKDGSEEYAERYYPATPTASAKIGKFQYVFSYPISNEAIEETELSEAEFEISRLAK